MEVAWCIFLNLLRTLPNKFLFPQLWYEEPAQETTMGFPVIRQPHPFDRCLHPSSNCCLLPLSSFLYLLLSLASCHKSPSSFPFAFYILPLESRVLTPGSFPLALAPCLLPPWLLPLAPCLLPPPAPLFSRIREGVRVTKSSAQDYPWIQDFQSTYDVLIVGGGIVGSMIAFMLTNRVDTGQGFKVGRAG